MRSGLIVRTAGCDDPTVVTQPYVLRATEAESPW